MNALVLKFLLCAPDQQLRSRRDILPTWILLRRFVGSLGSLPLPDSGSASQHLLLFISALIPKALASLLTSFTLALAGNQQVGRRSSFLLFFSFHVCERRLKLTSLCLCVWGGAGPSTSAGRAGVPSQSSAGGSETLASFHRWTATRRSGKLLVGFHTTLKQFQ